MKATHLFYGEDSYRLNLHLQAFKKHLASNNHKIVNFNPNIDDLESALFGGSLFAEQKALLFNLADLTENLLEKLAQSLDELPETLCIVIYLTGKLDRRLKTSKFLLSKIENIKEFEAFKQWQPEPITNWLLQRAQQLKINISNEIAIELVNYFGADTGKLDSELQRLSLYSDNISIHDVHETCNAEHDVFELADTLIFKSDLATSSKIAKDICSLYPPPVILAAIQNNLCLYRDMLSLQAHKSIGKSEIAQILGISPQRSYFVSDKLRKANLKINDLQRLISIFNECECRIKSGKSFNPEIDIRFAILQAS